MCSSGHILSILLKMEFQPLIQMEHIHLLNRRAKIWPCTRTLSAWCFFVTLESHRKDGSRVGKYRTKGCTQADIMSIHLEWYGIFKRVSAQTQYLFLQLLHLKQSYSILLAFILQAIGKKITLDKQYIFSMQSESPIFCFKTFSLIKQNMTAPINPALQSDILYILCTDPINKINNSPSKKKGVLCI